MRIYPVILHVNPGDDSFSVMYVFDCNIKTRVFDYFKSLFNYFFLYFLLADL